MNQQVQVSEPTGIHMVGETDPRTLASENFDKTPGLLFHPCLRPFTYQQHPDANIPDYFLEDATHETLGEGFYAMPDKSEAEVRSRIRQGSKNALPILITLMPYQARVFDMRDRQNPAKNGSVPTSMSQRWLQFFTDYFHSPERVNMPWTTTEPEERYFLFLKEVVRIAPLDLRAMLGTVPFPQSPNLPNPSWSRVFANFIIREGLDGIIYNEPSVISSGKSVPVYVFYTLGHVGTYESWHNPQVLGSPQRPS